MSVKRAGLIPFLACKCPRCTTGNVFQNSIFSLRKFADTNYSCPHCGLSFEPEPGFFFGAMYFSYALIVAIIFLGSVLFYTFNAFDYAVWGIPAIIILMLPLIFRYSRMMMLFIVYPLTYRNIFLDKKTEDPRDGSSV